jgi:hypothetical protein
VIDTFLVGSAHFACKLRPEIRDAHPRCQVQSFIPAWRQSQVEFYILKHCALSYNCWTPRDVGTARVNPWNVMFVGVQWVKRSCRLMNIRRCRSWNCACNLHWLLNRHRPVTLVDFVQCEMKQRLCIRGNPDTNISYMLLILNDGSTDKNAHDIFHGVEHGIYKDFPKIVRFHDTQVNVSLFTPLNKVRASLRSMSNSNMFKYHTPSFTQNRTINVESRASNSFAILRRPTLSNNPFQLPIQCSVEHCKWWMRNEAVVTHIHMCGLRKTRKT